MVLQIIHLNCDHHTHVNVTAEGWLSIDPDHTVSVGTVLEVKYQLEMFLSMCSGVRMDADLIEVSYSREPKDTAILFYDASDIVTCTIDDSRKYFLDFNSLPDLGDVLNKWFKLCKETPMMVGLAHSAVNSKGAYLHDNTLSLFQAIEAFHRALFDSKYMDDDKYVKDVNEVMLASIPTDIDQSHCTSLKSRIRFGNEVSLARRLRELASELPDKLRTALLGSSKKIPRAWIDTRNNFTHWDEKTKTGVPNDDWEIYFDGVKIKMFLRLLYLLRLGVSASTLEECLENQVNRTAIDFRHAKQQYMS